MWCWMSAVPALTHRRSLCLLSPNLVKMKQPRRKRRMALTRKRRRKRSSKQKRKGEIGPGHHSSKRGRTRSGKRARRKGVMTVTVKWTRPALIQNQIMTPIPQTHGDENTNTRSTGRLLKRSHGIITVTLIPVTESEQQTVVVCPLLKVAIAYLQFHWPSGCRDPSTESPAVGDLLLDKENVLSEVTLCEDPHRQT